ncbi:MULTISPECIES: Na+/H+ antiporter NhaA [Pasteurellaceae]|uniref:Na(+)/H(+) antiporter NhaA n=1 Tax=Pasteurella atlantica TaxID=2827233 RepID=A0AAW8CML7_9PAST|nr:Na+/H+ antiporter NhaA [Pasteurella atlantica]MBR0574016.1 Na+/H+ antiporter NhaA [Pasteurella atlantica]MDP8039978.1 Na+/H+ antiporter NhaA [Pasteurella atlantica]MDP8042092.1 Na+/H+ antiporter NhaA [Pasteurella atlantica]MDP8044272.1 Na+/H+ antiporter NhaA [Pasteurella atlantica]MDP8046291.1 Na+/H+ antiporter NhaA [Pasteurella atlantica]
MLLAIQSLLKKEPTSGILLFVLALVAMLFANTGLNSLYTSFLNMPVSIQVGHFEIDKSLLHWINDGFMAVFFILVGLEVKRELFEGSLSSYQQAIFPAIAAIGGMVIPALIFYMITYTSPELQKGWAIPMATDIAFALGIVALLGKRVQLALKVFLLALAIIDDLGAIVVIAIFYSDTLSMTALISASVAIVILAIMGKCKVSSIGAYILVGLVLWTSVLKSGVHATLAGVIIGFCIPLQGRNGERPLHQLEHSLVPWCSLFILPLFAFANAGVNLNGVSLSMVTSALPLGIVFGLIVGKPLGVFLFSYLSVKFRIATLPEGINFKQILAVAFLCGIGFTMSMFLASLAFIDGAGENLNILSRVGILIGSIVSAILGYILLRQTTKCIIPK